MLLVAVTAQFSLHNFRPLAVSTELQRSATECDSMPRLYSSEIAMSTTNSVTHQINRKELYFCSSLMSLQSAAPGKPNNSSTNIVSILLKYL